MRVTNLRNGRAVVVKVNDRGPIVQGRIIDLSYGAARVLQFQDHGLQKVRLDVVKRGTSQHRPIYQTIAANHPLAELPLNVLHCKGCRRLCPTSSLPQTQQTGLTFETPTRREKLIVALDVPTASAAHSIVSAVGDSVLTYKVGMQLYTAAGPQVVRDLVTSGRRVFLDLKYHDIPNTVAAAVREAADLGVSMLTVHAAGSGKMLRAATEAARGINPHLLVLGVTVLTSLTKTISKRSAFKEQSRKKSSHSLRWHLRVDAKES